MSYQPSPFKAEAEDIVITEEIMNKIEDIAQNVHDQWAKGRMDEGWTYGETRNDEEKKHPSLVPYDQLSEAEKEYDRTTAIITIQSLLALGFEITKVND